MNQGHPPFRCLRRQDELLQMVQDFAAEQVARMEVTRHQQSIYVGRNPPVLAGWN